MVFGRVGVEFARRGLPCAPPRTCTPACPASPQVSRSTFPLTHEYDRTARRAPVIVLEVRNAELMDSITKQAAEQGITYCAIVALIGPTDTFTVSTTPARRPHRTHLFHLPLAGRDDGHG